MEQGSAIDVLARPGGNDQVISKKVLLAALACAEADRLGQRPGADFVAAMRAQFLDGLSLADEAALARWLADVGVTDAEFESVMQDFAAVVAIEMHYEKSLAARVALHGRLIAARMHRLAELS